jgi:hypothetical protein
MKRRDELPQDVGIAALILLCIPVGFLITVAGLLYHFPTPGIFVGWLFPAPPGVVTLPILIAVGFVNGVCCYAIIWVLLRAVTRHPKGRP